MLLISLNVKSQNDTCYVKFTQDFVQLDIKRHTHTVQVKIIAKAWTYQFYKIDSNKLLFCFDLYYINDRIRNLSINNDIIAYIVNE